MLLHKILLRVFHLSSGLIHIFIYIFSSNQVLKVMWPEGKLRITEVTKRPLTAATLFKTSMISLVENLACKVCRRSLLKISHLVKPYGLNTLKAPDRKCTENPGEEPLKLKISDEKKHKLTRTQPIMIQYSPG